MTVGPGGLQEMSARQGREALLHGLLVPVEGRKGKAARGSGRPLRAQTARNETGLLVPAGGTWNDDVRSTGEPMRTRTTRETEAVVVVPLRANNRPKSIGGPLDTFAAAGNHNGLAMLMRNNTGGAEMCTPVDEPARTITTAGTSHWCGARTFSTPTTPEPREPCPRRWGHRPRSKAAS